jgi:hypothetical protein
LDPVAKRVCLILGLCVGLVPASGCPASGPDPLSYQLSHSGDHWDVVSGREFIPELQARYPEYFEVILDPTDTREPDLRPLRDDLERNPADSRNFDALHAVAVGYFELNYRGNASPGGAHYLSDNFRAAKLMAVPWRAYGQIDDGGLRDAILDFFEDAASGEKLATAVTAPRLARVVASLEAKETADPDRRERIHQLAERLAALQPEAVR